jgi:hypothetical protein
VAHQLRTELNKFRRAKRVVAQFQLFSLLQWSIVCPPTFKYAMETVQFKKISLFLETLPNKSQNLKHTPGHVWISHFGRQHAMF